MVILSLVLSSGAAYTIWTTVAKTIQQAVNAIASSSTEIAATIAQQERNASQQVASAMNALNQGASEVVNGITQTRASTQQLNEAALKLQTVV